ncbi:MAG: hypothetical protein QE280_09560 [Caulobacter sp.]|jgi:hypothetical protein|nr:hypothetical protein [Caulobacter sp.]
MKLPALLTTIAAAAALLAPVGLAAPARAQTAASPLISSWTLTEMKAMMVADGMTVNKVSLLENDTPFLALTTKDDVNFGIQGAACNGEGLAQRCSGAILVSSVDFDTAASAKAVLAELDFAAVTITSDGGESLSLNRYVIFDHGIHRKNLSTNVEVFLNILEQVMAME